VYFCLWVWRIARQVLREFESHILMVRRPYRPQIEKKPGHIKYGYINENARTRPKLFMIAEKDHKKKPPKVGN